MGQKQSSPPPPPPEPPYVPSAKGSADAGKPSLPPRETASLQLSLDPEPASCKTCRLTVDPTLSSATVILTRNILGKLDAPRDPAPSDSWVWDPYVIKDENGVPKLAETWGQIQQRCGSPFNTKECIYVRADPSTHGTTIDGRKVDAGGAQKQTFDMQLSVAFNDDLAKWKADQASANAKNQKPKKMVRIWNPSDDPTDINGSQSINYKNHGALTKLYLKPTIPFNITFDPTGMASVPRPPTAQRIAPEAKKLPGPPTGPLVRGPATL